jgi:hypothetical protein
MEAPWASGKMRQVDLVEEGTMLQWKNTRLIAALVALTMLSASFGSWGWFLSWGWN